jgi:adenine-specific DNA-methyltransferase
MNTTDTNPLDAVSSPDINAERLAALKRLFPDLFSNEGRLNVDELKKVVDPSLVTESERYDFRWYGKTASKREAFTPSRAALIYDPARSVNPDKAGGNIIIEGENLEVLKLLNCAYRERVKCIYIDPPYNTGKDFVYSDRFAEGQKPYWEQTGVTENGVKVDSNSDSDGRFHSNWLSMMHSRLLASRYLLAPDGAIFVSIDENEVHVLKRLMDEVFGEEAFVADIAVVNNLKGRNDKANIATAHENLLIYCKPEFQTYGLPLTEKQIAEYGQADDDGEAFQWRDLRKRGGADSREERPSLYYPLYADKESGKVSLERAAKTDVEIFPKKSDGSDGCWRWSKNKVSDKIAQIKATKVEGKNRWNIFYRVYLQTDGEMRVAKPKSVWIGSQYSTDAATKTLRALVPDVDDITPKPVGLLQTIICQAMEDDDIILDFFAGSGTTAQAVMEMNKNDGGNRQFILVQLPERTIEGSSNYRAGFKRVSDITIERAKRVIQKIQKDADNHLPGDAMRQFSDSLGFKVYTLAKSRFPRVEFAPDPEKTVTENVEALKRYIADKEQSFHIQLDKEPVRDELLLKQGFMFDYTLTPQPEFTNNEVVLARDMHKESLLCLDAVIAPETVDYFQAHKDRFFICLELALDTTKKWNLKHHLADKLKTV